ncbi:MAG: hypothetical protein J6Q85_04425 [Clostridia bacterium]|nr:hypothetical protein [Clostridia bacterium]
MYYNIYHSIFEHLKNDEEELIRNFSEFYEEYNADLMANQNDKTFCDGLTKEYNEIVDFIKERFSNISYNISLYISCRF